MKPELNFDGTTVYPSDKWADQGCSSPTTRHYNQWLVLPYGWNWSDNAKKYAKKVIGMQIENGQYITNASGRDDGTHAFVDIYTADSSCNPTIAGWSAKTCVAQGVAKYWSNLSVKGGSWEDSGKWWVDNRAHDFSSLQSVSTKNDNVNGQVIELWLNNDNDCYATWGAWTDGGCSSLGVHHYYNKLNVPGPGWTSTTDQNYWADAANYVATNIQSLLPTYNKQTVTSATGRADVTGSYVDIYTTDNTGCNATFDTQHQGCDNAGNLLTISNCNNWQKTNSANVYADSITCVSSPNKPSNVTAWIQCGIGSSPGGVDPNNPSNTAIGCSTIQNTASPTSSPCGWGTNCYAIIGSYGQDPRCQSNYQDVLTSQANAITSEMYPNNVGPQVSVKQNSSSQSTIFILLCLVCLFICLIII